MDLLLQRVIRFSLNLMRRLMHPVAVFVTLQFLFVGVTVIWVTWFINQNEAIARLTKTLGDQNIDSHFGLIFFVLGCVLLGMILVGTVVLFVFTQKQTSLIRQQRNFLSSVTHELRSPLASLQLTTETMQKHAVPEEVRTQLNDMALADIERLMRLVDRILISARLDRGIVGFDTTPEQFNIKDFFDKIYRQSLYLDRNLARRITIDCPDGLEIHFPKMPLSLILGNLLENAIHYSPKESPISLKAWRENNHLHIAVADKGFGLTKKDKTRIFGMFHRAETAVKKAVPGTGLGLYIVRFMARQLNGDAWAESPGLGQGSTFHVLLPLTGAM